MNSLRLLLSFASIVSLAACGSSGGTSPAPADAATSASQNVAAICATARRLNCSNNALCERDLTAVFNGVPARCASERDAYAACAARSTTSTCAMFSMGQFAGCEAQNTAIQACADGDASTPPADASPPPTDVGDAAAACGAAGAACCAGGGDPCRAGTNCDTASNRCETCGGDGQICCPATTATCGAGLRCAASLRCSAVMCGGEGEPCCATDAGPSCDGTNRCDMGTCRAIL